MILCGIPAFCIATARDDEIVPSATLFSTLSSSSSFSATYFSSSSRITVYFIPPPASIIILSRLSNSPNGTSTVFTIFMMWVFNAAAIAMVFTVVISINFVAEVIGAAILAPIYVKLFKRLQK